MESNLPLPTDAIRNQIGKLAASQVFEGCARLRKLLSYRVGDGVVADRVEQYCNDGAGEFLLPTKEVRTLGPALSGSPASVAGEITTFAEARRVSSAMVTYKLLRARLIAKTVWQHLDQHFKRQWLQFKGREAEKNKAAEGGPNYYVVRRHRVGSALLGLVRRSLDDGNITYTKAGRILGVKPRSVEPLLSVTRGAR